MIDLHNVGKQFDGKRKVTALSGVNLNIRKGEMVSIVGPSGSGKSTLLNMVGGSRSAYRWTSLYRWSGAGRIRRRRIDPRQA